LASIEPIAKVGFASGPFRCSTGLLPFNRLWGGLPLLGDIVFRGAESNGSKNFSTLVV